MNKLRIFALVLLSIGALYVALSYLILPGMAHARVARILSAAGFDTSFMPGPQAAVGAIYYDEIPLDKDGFSSIKTIKAVYDPASLLLAGKFYSIEISGLNLTGDWTGENSEENTGSPSFAGWEPPIGAASLPLEFSRYLAFKHASISLLTPKAGGVSLTFDLVASRKEDKTEFQGNFRSAQKFLTFAAAVSGFVSGAQWSADIDLEDGKFEDPSGDVKAARMNGTVKLSAFPAQALMIAGDLRAGGAQFFGLPWNSVSANVELSGGNLKIVSEGKSAGNAGLEFEVRLNKKDGAPLSAEGSVHADRASSLLSYLKGRPAFQSLRSDIAAVRGAAGLTVSFRFSPDKPGIEGLKYEILEDGAISKTPEEKNPSP